MSLDVIVGLQRGDEGKGRFVDLVAGNYDIIARANGGANAGHTVIPKIGDEPLALHQIPSGVAYPGKLNIIGNGVYLDPQKLVEEMNIVRKGGLEVTPKNLLISHGSHLVFPHHKILDTLREESKSAQGSTKSGIAYVAADKYLREGLRLECIVEPDEMHKHAIDGLEKVNNLLDKSNKLSKNDIDEQVALFIESARSLEPYMADTIEIINDCLYQGKNVLAEGAQAYWLDINHGMYPAVTSSSTTVSGLLDGLGVSAKYLGKVIGVTKAVKSHVGGGPLVTEVTDEKLASKVRGPLGKTDSEYGVTTKRPRRIGFPDLVELRNAIRVNGVDELAISKLDHVPRYGSQVPVAIRYSFNGKKRRTAPTSALALENCTPEYKEMPTWSQELSHVRDYKNLPPEAVKFIELFESELDVPVTRIGVGPNREEVIFKDK